MKSRFLLSLLLTIHCSLFTIPCPAQDAEQIYKKVNDAVVTVYAYDSYQQILTQGSGVVLNDKGWIVTNYHVYNGSDKMVVRHNGKIVEYTFPVNSEQLTVNSCHTSLFTVSCSLFTVFDLLNVG